MVLEVRVGYLMIKKYLWITKTSSYVAFFQLGSVVLELGASNVLASVASMVREVHGASPSVMASIDPYTCS